MNHINAVMDGGREARVKVMEQPKERIDSVVYFSIWRSFAPLPQRHLCALTTTLETFSSAN